MSTDVPSTTLNKVIELVTQVSKKYDPKTHDVKLVGYADSPDAINTFERQKEIAISGIPFYKPLSGFKLEKMLKEVKRTFNKNTDKPNGLILYLNTNLAQDKNIKDLIKSLEDEEKRNFIITVVLQPGSSVDSIPDIENVVPTDTEKLPEVLDSIDRKINDLSNGMRCEF